MVEDALASGVESTYAGVEMTDEGVKSLGIETMRCQAGAYEGRFAIEVPAMNICAGGDKGLDCLVACSACGYVERSVTLFVQDQVHVRGKSWYIRGNLAYHFKNVLGIVSSTDCLHNSRPSRIARGCVVVHRTGN